MTMPNYKECRNPEVISQYVRSLEADKLAFYYGLYICRLPLTADESFNSYAVADPSAPKDSWYCNQSTDKTVADAILRHPAFNG